MPRISQGKQRTKNKKHKTQNTEHKTKNTKHKTKNNEPPQAQTKNIHTERLALSEVEMSRSEEHKTLNKKSDMFAAVSGFEAQ